MSNNDSNKVLDISPFNPTVSELLVKVSVGFVTGLVVVLLIFILIVLFGSFFKQAISVSISWSDIRVINPGVAIIMLVIGFIVWFLGSVILWTVYNFLLSDRYYDIGKIFSFSVMINGFILLFFAFLYMIFNNSIDQLLLVLIFHIGFSLYISLQGYDIISNPNYSLLYLFSHSLSFLIVVVFALVWYKIFQKLWTSEWSLASLLIYFVILLYVFYPAINYVIEKIYYKLYEWWNTSLYTPSIDEILVDEEVVDEVNVEIEENK